MRARVPAAALGDKPLLILPLEDERLQSLHVMLSPGIYKPDEEGYVYVRVINPMQHPVRVAHMAPIGRFIIDPSIKDADLEFTSEEIIETIQMDPGCSRLRREDVLYMLQTRRRLFASKLGWVHIAKHSVKLAPGDVPP